MKHVNKKTVRFSLDEQKRIVYPYGESIPTSNGDMQSMRTKLCIMTAYADETLALLNVLGQDVSDSVDWNSRLQFEGVDGDKQSVVMQSGMGKGRAASKVPKLLSVFKPLGGVDRATVDKSSV